jgi:uncharacterized damage-inducible protein DinB
MAKKTRKASKSRKPAKKPASKASAGSKPTEFSAKAQFLNSFQKEHVTTMKVLRAYPAEQAEFRPHPRSQCARDLAFTFQMEQRLIALAIKDQLTLGGGMPKASTDFAEIVSQFEKEFADLVALIKKTSDADLEKTVTFPSGPGQLAAWPKLQFAWFMLSDQIHHRGQMSVYLRMAGGKVPAIYGPSADEPWT